ncbi:MAG: VTT domain-containing protein [Dehalococcoidales bacterium]|nr:VTT domain-containing protein [Dehalococcoidales bacterium]
MVNNMEQARTGKHSKIPKRIIGVATLLLVIVISLGLFYYGKNPERVAALKEYRYLGAFLVSLIGNATVLLPGIVLPVLSGLGLVFYPVTGIMGPILVGVAGGAGAAIGELVGYTAGYSGRNILQSQKKHYARLEGWIQKWGTLAIFFGALLPLFFDLIGIAAGALRFPLWKFILICWIARTILYVGVVVAICLGWEATLPIFTGVF